MVECGGLDEHAIDQPDIDLGRLRLRAFHGSVLMLTMSVTLSVSPSFTVEWVCRLSNNQQSPTAITTRSSPQVL